MAFSWFKPSKKEVQKALESSYVQGIKRGVIEAEKTIYSPDDMCMMTYTPAENPDPEHAELEGLLLPCEEVLGYLERYGCQHQYIYVPTDQQ